MRMLRELAFMSWFDANEYFKDNDAVIISIGSKEQYDSHKPLGIDYLIVGGIAKAIEDNTGTLYYLLYPFASLYTTDSF